MLPKSERNLCLFVGGPNDGRLVIGDFTAGREITIPIRDSDREFTYRVRKVPFATGQVQHVAVDSRLTLDAVLDDMLKFYVEAYRPIWMRAEQLAS